MKLLTLSRMFTCLAIAMLLAAGCGADASVEVGDEPAADAVANDEPESEPTEVPPTPEPEPTPEPTEVPPTPEPEPTPEPSEPEPTPEPSEPEPAPEPAAETSDDPTVSEDGYIVLGSRDEALAFLEGEGFVPGDAECIAEGAFDILGTWDFIAFEPNPEQEAELDVLLDNCVTTVPGPAAGSPPPGTDAELDALWIACDEGDPTACDELYFGSPVDSDYEAFGLSCGGRAIDNCAIVLGDGEVPGPAAGSPPPGTDAELDELWIACDAGSAEACDSLFWTSPSDSDYETFGLTCGGRTAGGLCGDLLDG